MGREPPRANSSRLFAAAAPVLKSERCINRALRAGVRRLPKNAILASCKTLASSRHRLAIAYPAREAQVGCRLANGRERRGSWRTCRAAAAELVPMASAKSAGRLFAFCGRCRPAGLLPTLERLRRALNITLRQPRENRGGASSKLPPQAKGAAYRSRRARRRDR